MRSFEENLKNLLYQISSSPDEKLNHFMDGSSPERRQAFQEATKNFLIETDFTRVLTHSGIAVENSFFQELLRRLTHHWFSEIYPDKDFRSFFARLNEEIDADGILLKISPSTLERFLAWITPEDEKLRLSMRVKISSSLRILAIRLANHGISWQISDRLNERAELQSSFLEAENQLREFLKNPHFQNFQKFKDYLNLCHEACEYIRSKKSVDGISLDLTFRIVIIQDVCYRLQQLASLYMSLTDPTYRTRIVMLARDVLSAEAESMKVSELFFRYLELVFYQITEYTGQAGGAYIKEDARGYWEMLKKGLIGGVLVGGLAFFKPLASQLNLAPALEALTFSLIYSYIFVLIYFCSGVLATKQPAMTASRIAQSLDAADPSRRFLWQVSEMIRLTFRTQVVAVFGNFIIAFPVAAAVYWLWSWAGLPRLTDDKADYLMESLNPIASFSLYYAALTGGCLALSGILAGASRNWFVFNRIEKRLVKSLPQIKFVTRERAQRIVKWLDQHLTALVSNISLGLMLGSLSVLGFIFALPLDVRHITFASAQLGTSWAHFNFAQPSMDFFMALIGVILIGAINLIVSFGITFSIVLKSRQLTFLQGRELARLCFKRFLKHPLSFLIP